MANRAHEWPAPDCQDLHRLCFPNPATAPDGAECPIPDHEGRVNRDCECASCVELDAAEAAAKPALFDERTPACELCRANLGEKVRAQFIAAQSTDGGWTVKWIMVCEDHRAGWNDGGDWTAPIFRLAEREE